MQQNRAIFVCMACSSSANCRLLRRVYVCSISATHMRVRVITACLLMLTVSLAGCVSDPTVEEISDTIEEITESVEILGCMDETALNYDAEATNDSKLCLSMEQLIQAEDVFWNSWTKDAVDDLTAPVGYRLMIDESITRGDEGENVTNRSMVVQEVFSSDYYDQKIEYKVSDEYILDDVIEVSYYSGQTVFDNVVQVEKFSDGEWDNYSMDTASTYDEFRNRSENGPGIRSSSGYGVAISQEADARSETSARSGDGGPGSSDCDDTTGTVRPCGFPSVAGTDFESIDVHELELRGSNRAQTIYYFAKDTNTGTDVEVMGEMTEDGFKITEYCNQIPSTNHSIIASYMGVSTDAANGSEISNVLAHKISARIILLETDGTDLRFEEYDYDEPVSSQSDDFVGGLYASKAIPFYFDWISDEVTNDSESNSETDERKGLNGVNVNVVIAGSSGAYGMGGDLSEYRLITSNCTLDNATTGEEATVVADEEETSARSEKGNQSESERNESERYEIVDDLPIYGSDGNTCVNIDVYDLSNIDGMLERGITFVDADSSGTLTEGDRFEFDENYTCDDCDEANMLRLYSTSADEFSDGNIKSSSETSLIHQGAMNAVRNVRSVDFDVPAPPVMAQDHNSTRSNRAN